MIRVTIGIVMKVPSSRWRWTKGDGLMKVFLLYGEYRDLDKLGREVFNATLFVNGRLSKLEQLVGGSEPYMIVTDFSRPK